MSVLGWILFGFVVGLIARAITPGRDPLGLIGTVVLGIIGALVAGWTGQALGFYLPDEGAGFFSATLGAVFVLSLYTFALRRARIRRLQEMAEFQREQHKVDANQDRSAA